VGDQFALMEAVVALAVTLKRFDFELVPGQRINMTTGATIHTTDGLYMTMRERRSSGSGSGSGGSSSGSSRAAGQQAAAAAAAAAAV
jgi:carotene epsilon-monooxygenase